MNEKRIAATLIDVGRTLWAEHPTHWVDVESLRITRLCEMIPTLDRSRASQLLRDVLERASRLENVLELDIHGVIRDVTDHLQLPIEERDIDSIRAAIAVPMAGIADLLDGARELLRTVKELDLRCIIASNTIFRNEQGYRQDFRDQRLSECINGIVTSLDVGYRKPHRAIFEAAMAMAGCDAGQCVFIGNSERNDVEPSVALGMRCNRVAIEEPMPEKSAADVVVTSLTDSAQILRKWDD
jgi:putative hydrolase of the HAD superfamily